MPKRITNMSITLVRDGKRIKLPAGVAFDFTKDELEELKEIVKDAVRTPINEAESIAEVKAPESAKTAGKTDSKAAAKSGTDGEF